MHEFVAKDGNTYYIDLDDGETIYVSDVNGCQMGSVTLMHVNSGDGRRPESGYFYLQHLDLQRCKRLGIGTEIFRLHNECFGEPITAATQFGPKMDDGSHLIEDGIPFVKKMRDEGLICPAFDDDEDPEDD